MMLDRRKIDYGLYLVTDRFLAGGRSLEEIVRKAAEGGIRILQHREKNAGTREFLLEALALKRTASEFGIPFIINDRIDIALACGAEGIHLGQDDMPCTIARRLVGEKMIIGVSVSTPEEALEAESDGADYLGVGPLFSTLTKTDTVPPIGIETLARIRRAVRIPLVAIGGINIGNAAEVIRGGADGVAVVSAIISSQNPEIAANELMSVVNGSRAEVEHFYKD